MNQTLGWVLFKKYLNELLVKATVLFYAVKGNYPWWMVTPDDPKSPFGSGTTPTASTEPTQMKIYRRFGRYVGDVIWLGWRNSGYGYAYSLKPDWLKDPNIKYEDLSLHKETSGIKTTYVVSDGKNTLVENQYKLGPLYLLVGHRVQPVYDGGMRNRSWMAEGRPPAKLPAFHPNMDGRPVLSIRSTRTM
jgi:hypothetical protein